jgi:exodeoxyribonuclease VII small subunit
MPVPDDFGFDPDAFEQPGPEPGSPSNRGQSASDSPQSLSFEAGLARLGEIVSRLESGGLGLSESIDAYERGVGILRHLHEELSRVEARVRLLTGVDEEGQAVVESMPSRLGELNDGTNGEPPAGKESLEKPGRRAAPRTPSSAKTARARRLPGMDDPSAGV